MENLPRMMNTLLLLFEDDGMNSVVIVGTATVFLLAILFVHGIHKHSVPTGPRALPIVGHFHLLTNKKTPIHRILDSLSKVYGPIMHLRFGSRPVLIISCPELAKECFTVNDLSFACRPQLAQGQHLGYNFSLMGWDPYGDYWSNARKICALELLSSKQIQTFRPKRMREICKVLHYLFQQSLLENRVINIRNVLSQLMLNILLTMVINDQYFGGEAGISFSEVAHLIEETFVLHGAFNIGDYIRWLKWLDLQGYEKAMKKTQEKLDPYMQRIVEKHRENPPKAKEDMDFIDMLILQAEEHSEAIPDKDTFIKAIAVTMFSAGVDTSSHTIEWVLSLLMLHPDIMKKAQEEVDSITGGGSRLVEESDIAHLKYLQAIVKETMRLYAPAPLLMPHKSITDCTVGGFHIPAGTTLMVNAWTIQRNPRLWKQPLEFMPERFLGNDIEIENILSKGNTFEMIPFGAGRRACPGASLAMCTVHIILARLLQTFHWSVPNGKVLDIQEGIGLTMPKAVPLEAVVTARFATHLYLNPWDSGNKLNSE